MTQRDDATLGRHRAGGPAARPALSARHGAEAGPGAGTGPQAAGTARSWPRETAVLIAFVAAGVAVTWPRTAYLSGRLPAGGDQAQYVWSLWWVAHQIAHLASPWSTGYLAAPVGVQLGFDTLMPLAGLVMAPVTLAFGPSASFTLLAAVTPGLAGYAAYRTARLWLPGLAGPVTAGACFGLSAMVTWQDWYHVNIAAGAVFLPLALTAAVRLRRAPTIGRGVTLGAVLGAAVLVNQESAVMALIPAGLALVPGVVRTTARTRLAPLAAGALACALIASPQLAAMAQQAAAGGATPQALLARGFTRFSSILPSLFAPSPRLARYGLPGLASLYRAHTAGEGMFTFGVVLTVTALAGLALTWRRRAARLLALAWAGAVALALGPGLWLGGRDVVPLPLTWHGARMSVLAPYTWLVQVPGLSAFREPDRFALLGLLPAALLAGAAVTWLRRRAWPLIIVVAVLLGLEAGWPGMPGQATMPTTLAAVDRPIAADHSASVVVDAPFGLRGGLAEYGSPISPMALVLATADGHPRAVSYTSWVASTTIAGIRHHAFYAGLVAAQQGAVITPARLAAARRDLRALHVGWVLVWTPAWMRETTVLARPLHLDYPAMQRYLTATGLRLSSRADQVAVYRPAGPGPG